MLSVILGLSLLWSATTAAEEVYGKVIEPKDVPESVEQCEYDLLVEQQSCNRRINKSECIKETHQFCLENFSDLPYPGPYPGTSPGPSTPTAPPEDAENPP